MRERRRKVDELAQIKEPQKVRVLILTEQKASMKDFFFIRTFNKLKKMDLSYNKLSSFPVGFSFGTFTQLRILYLHYNKFVNIKSILPLADCRSLQYLTLFGNSLEQAKTRHLMINQIPTLKLMDDKIVKIQERTSQLFDQRTSIIKLSFPIITSLLTDNSTTFLAAVIEELFIIRKYYLQCNPILKIQRYWKMKFRKLNSGKRIKIVLNSLYPMTEEEQNRLVTEKLCIHRSTQEKIVSVLTMNLQFWRSIKKMSHGRIFAIRQYCLNNDLPFLELNPEGEKIGYLVLRKPSKPSVKSFLQFFIQTGSMFIFKKFKKQSTQNNITTLKLPARDNNHRYKLTEKELQILTKSAKKIEHLESKYLDQIVVLDMSAERKFSVIKRMYLKCQIQSRVYPFCFEETIFRATSAICIQRVWRGYQVRKIQTIRSMIIQNRNACKIQHWIRNQSFIHRHRFLLYVRPYLKSQNTQSLTISTQLLSQLAKYNTKINTNRNLLIPFQNSQLTFDGSRIQICSLRSPCPLYLKDHVSISCAEKGHAEYQSNLLEDLLFRHCERIEYIVNNRHSFCQITYQSVQEAKNRKFLLALKTYNMLNHTFVRSFDLLERKKVSQVKCINEVVEQQCIISSNTMKQTPVLSKLQWKKIKIRYFNGKDDHSCLINVVLMNPVLLYSQTRHKLKVETVRKPEAKITRNYLALQESASYNPPQSFRYAERNKQLITDQSLQSFINQGNDIFKLKDSSQDTLGVRSLIESVYGENNLDFKRSRVHQLRENHKERIATITQKKQQNLKRIKIGAAEIQQKNAKLLQQKRVCQHLEKIRQSNRIRQSSHKTDNSFQQSFIMKGNRSMKMQLLRFERHRNIINVSSRKINRSLNPIANSMDSSRLVSKLKKDKSKEENNITQIRQFSVNQSSEPAFGRLESMNFKSRQSIDPKVIRQIQLQINHNENNKGDKNLTKSRPKLIHSVFPQECYPLKESKKKGFQLPKLKK